MNVKRISWLIIFALVSVSGFSQDVKKIKVTELARIIAENKGPLIINFWATFCKPCIEEMPAFEKMAAKYKQKGVQLIFVSLDMQDDYPKKVNAFVTKRKIKSRVTWLDETDADYFIPKIDSSWSGAIPATLFVNSQKGYKKFLEEQLSEEKLEKEIMAIL